MTILSESFGSATTGTAKFLTGNYAVSISGTFVGTVQLQRRYGGTGSWGVVDTYTEPTEVNGFEPVEEDVEYRLECTAYTSGTAIAKVLGPNKARGYARS